MHTVPQNSTSCRNPLSSRVSMLDKLSASARADLESLAHESSYSPNNAIFTERELAHGLYFVRSGEIRISINSAEGKRLSLRIARAGDVLGLASILSGGTYTDTAETLYPTRLAYISRHDFLAFLTKHPDAYPAVLEEISRKVFTACEQLRTVALSNSAPEKLARLLLEWSENSHTSEEGCRIRMPLTHEQIGEFIGASRETVTRTLTNFKHRRLVSVEGSMLTIPNLEALASYAL